MTYELACDLVAYTLTWPRELLRDELRVLLTWPPASLDVESAGEWLLKEAFASDEPCDEFSAISRSSTWGFPGVGQGRRDMLQRLLVEIDTLPEQGRPRPYYRQRQRPTVDAGALRARSFEEQQAGWARVVYDLLERGYLDKVAPRDCVDDHQRAQDEVLDEHLARLLGQEGLWPFEPRGWSEDDFYSLVEAVGDLIARPRTRWFHDHSRCGWHYDNFAAVPGRMPYRARVNEVLAGTGLALASEGEDVGRLAHTVDDGREDLLAKVLVTPDSTIRGPVAHALALFRARGADREAKRSAVVALARLLEHRQSLLKRELFSKDEDALFRVANKFDLRHRDGKQHPEYDEAYLDWIFWWYLATIELSNRLIARDALPTGDAT